MELTVRSGVCQIGLLADRLRRLRSQREASQGEVANALGIGRATYANWETSRTAPAPDTLRRLADFYSVSVDYLLGRVDRTGEGSLPDWLAQLPLEMQDFVKEEASSGCPYLRLARGLKMQDLTKREFETIVAAWMDVEKGRKKELGK